jgi:hypothetical protein
MMEQLIPYQKVASSILALEKADPQFFLLT